MMSADFNFRGCQLTAFEDEDGQLSILYWRKRKDKFVYVSERIEDACNWIAAVAIREERERLEHEFKSGGW